jgi:hypothetical protein
MTLSELLRKSWRGRERRAHERVEAPALTLTTAGMALHVLDWSLGGIRIAPPDSGRTHGRSATSYKVGDKIKGKASLAREPSTPPERGEFVAEVVRTMPDGALALRWVEVSSALFVTMAETRGW